MAKQVVVKLLPWGLHQAKKCHIKKEAYCQESYKTSFNKFKQMGQSIDIPSKQHFWKFTMSILLTC